jgi:hypothetical protein
MDIFLFSWYQWLFSRGQIRWGVKLTTDYHPVAGHE